MPSGPEHPMTALDHIALSTADYATSLAFYEVALAPLGVTTHMKFEGPDGNVAGLGSISRSCGSATAAC